MEILTVPRVSAGWQGAGPRVDILDPARFAAHMDALQFSGTIRYWNPEKGSGLAVVDIPAEQVPALGGLKQQRVHGRIGPAEFTSSVMPSGGGRLALSVSKAMMQAAGVAIGDTAAFAIIRVGGD